MTAPRSSTNSRRRASASPLDRFRELGRQITLDNGRPFEAEPWQCDVVGDLLAGKPEVHLWVPEANGKTTLAALVAIHHLLTRPDPRIVVAAASELQARTLYNQAEGMVLSSPWLEDELSVRTGTLEIRVRHGVGGLKVIAADQLRAHGQINSLVILDEMHAHPGLGLYRVLAGKLTKREGAQLLSISTAGEPDSEFEQMRSTMLTEAALIERRGPRCIRVEDEQYAAWCWALQPEDDIDDMELVALANPLGTMTPEVLAGKRARPGYEEKHWRTFACNLPTRDFVYRFLAEGDWDAANVGADCPTIPEGVPIIVGADWGWTDDATAIEPAWFDEDDMLLLGPLTVVEPPRNGTDLTPQEVLAAIGRLEDHNPIAVIAHDESAHGGGKIMTGLLVERFPYADVVPVTNANADDAPGYFNEQLRAGRLKHTGDPTLRRHLMNAVRVPVRGDTERFRIARVKESRHAPHQRPVREIDGAVAAVNAVWGAIGREPTPEPFMFVVGEGGLVRDDW